MAMRRMSDIVRNQNPLMLSQGTTVKHACSCMHKRQVGAVLVTGEGATSLASSLVATRWRG
jgi:hypothetical protein